MIKIITINGINKYSPVDCVRYVENRTDCTTGKHNDVTCQGCPAYNPEWEIL